MSNREMNTSNKKKAGNGNGNSVINNHEYSNKVNSNSSVSSTGLDNAKDIKDNKKED
ncbi:MAG: hypothetical protein K0S41_1486 [Anaerocolumna sp.]|jgi:hypothetical protein|nr:hypothetical protein [Anaerocolumna sp.]